MMKVEGFKGKVIILLKDSSLIERMNSMGIPTLDASACYEHFRDWMLVSSTKHH